MDFRTVNLAAALVCATLFAGYLFIPGLIFTIFGVELTPESAFAARRMAMLFLGLAALTFTAASSNNPSAPSLISLPLALAMAGLSLASLGELVRGFAGSGILLAAVAEALFAFAYFRFWLSAPKT